MLNMRWPGDVPPLKRLFAMKLRAVYLKKQVYNYAHYGGEEPMWMDGCGGGGARLGLLTGKRAEVDCSIRGPSVFAEIWGWVGEGRGAVIQ